MVVVHGLWIEILPALILLFLIVILLHPIGCTILCLTEVLSLKEDALVDGSPWYCHGVLIAVSHFWRHVVTFSSVYQLMQLLMLHFTVLVVDAGLFISGFGKHLVFFFAQICRFCWLLHCFNCFSCLQFQWASNSLGALESRLGFHLAHHCASFLKRRDASLFWYFSLRSLVCLWYLLLFFLLLLLIFIDN